MYKYIFFAPYSDPERYVWYATIPELGAEL